MALIKLATLLCLALGIIIFASLNNSVEIVDEASACAPPPTNTPTPTHYWVSGPGASAADVIYDEGVVTGQTVYLAYDPNKTTLAAYGFSGSSICSGKDKDTLIKWNCQ